MICWYQINPADDAPSFGGKNNNKRLKMPHPQLQRQRRCYLVISGTFGWVASILAGGEGGSMSYRWEEVGYV